MPPKRKVNTTKKDSKLKKKVRIEEKRKIAYNKKKYKRLGL